MNVQRLVHSCLVLAQDQTKVLIDPGNLSWQDNFVREFDYRDINYILISHKHPDHCEPAFISEVLRQSPQARVVCNDEVAVELEKHAISTESELPTWLQVTTRQHARLWEGMPQITNSIFTVWGKLTHFGDNREIDSVEHADLVAFPIVAPWGSLVDAIDKLLATPPKTVIPIHDWHLSTAGREYYYQRFADALHSRSITVLPLGPLDSFDIN